jgi:hypothetical protein
MTATVSTTPRADARLFPLRLAVALRLAELIDRLPRADPTVLLTARAVAVRAAAEGWGEHETGVQVWRQLDWLPVYLHFGRTRGWHSARVRTLAPDELLEILEADVALAAPISSLEAA